MGNNCEIREESIKIIIKRLYLIILDFHIKIV